MCKGIHFRTDLATKKNDPKGKKQLNLEPEKALTAKREK